MYRYHFDKARNLLDISWSGLFAQGTVVEYGKAIWADFHRHGFRQGYRLLIDMSGSNIQPQHNLAHFRAQFADFPKASRIAVVTQSALHRLQILREMPQPYLRVLPSRGAALNWVLHGVE
ncbi:STAS/SEC14 domain-containing protein [Sphingomonas sp. IW22]|uniref:STAS/SEC14 domain-containing protein n=1 Tax=Sphingomonas sp. IW22 TaxID=3242489 RepID=UPI003522A036